MHEVFDPIEITWEGKTLKIPADKVLGAVNKVEEVVTLTKLIKMAEVGAGDGTGISVSLLSKAYGSVLRYAGADVTDDHVYVTLLGAGRMSIEETKHALFLLLQILLPKTIKAQDRAKQVVASGNAVRPTTSALSKRTSKRSSGKAKLPHASSGP